jgi:hypothetical protein
MIPRSFIAGVAAICAFAAHANTVALQDNLPLRLSCTGLMFTGSGGLTESRVATLGLIDIEHKRAGGFGLGKLPVLSASAMEVRFGSSALDEGSGQQIEGSFDRASGDVAITVRSQKRPAEILIRMELSCRVAEPVS